MQKTPPRPTIDHYTERFRAHMQRVMCKAAARGRADRRKSEITPDSSRAPIAVVDDVMDIAVSHE